MPSEARELAALLATRASAVLERLVDHLRSELDDAPALRHAATLLLLRRLVDVLAHARTLPRASGELPDVDAALEQRGGPLADALVLELLDTAPVRTRRGRRSVTLALPEPAKLPLELLGHVYETWLGSARKGRGAFYTPPELAGPTLRRTLQPLTHVLEQGAWRVRDAASITALRVCDPAMGAGAFLLAALDWLAEALNDALQRDEAPTPSVRARAATCLHGVDLDPIAVALGRITLWLAIADPTCTPAQPGAGLRHGNALIGCRRAWLARYPVHAWSREGGDRHHATFVHHVVEREGERRGDAWTCAIRAERATIVQALARLGPLAPPPDRRESYDAWCATWFWPADALALAPRPTDLQAPSEATQSITRQLAAALGFFHWELEFPQVFARGGFDAVIGNPPWDVQKPNSKEFFSAHDPGYPALDKQAALAWQRHAFARAPALERAWIEHQAGHKAFANWVTHTCEHQGSADLDSYKLFVERAHALLREGGRLGMIVPSGLYADKGAAPLRGLLLDHCNWEWLYAFENHAGIFDIHRSFKFAAIVLEKGGRTDAIHTAFMVGDLATWQAEPPPALALPRSLLTRLSPHAHAFVELRDARDLELLDHLHAQGVPLGERGGTWDLEYVREFDMTLDSHRFAPRERWEAQGYRADEYGHWLRGPWRPGARDELDADRVRSHDRAYVLDLDAIDDVALPLYQGAMIQSFDFAAGSSWLTKHIEPRSLMAAAQAGPRRELQVGFRDIARTTDRRTMIATLLPGMPCGNKVPLLRCASGRERELVAVLGSFVFDWLQRTRQVGSTLNHHVIAEQPLPRPCPALDAAAGLVLHLNAAHPMFARTWLRHGDRTQAWRRRWALLPAERLRLRVILDALVAHAYGLDAVQLRHILAGCDHARPDVHRMWTKGFWRVDKDQPPELRHPVLVQVAFAQLERGGLAAFLDQHEGEGWQLPEQLRLADFGLGHDARALAAQDVAGRQGPRFVEWQRDEPIAASWAECEVHAERLRRIQAS